MAMKKLALLLALISSPALAQQRAQTVAQSPTPQGLTITTTNTFQQALASAARNSCLVQYLGSNTGFVFFGTTATASTPASFQLSKGQSISCSNPNTSVLTDAVQISGTSGDQFVVTAQ